MLLSIYIFYKLFSPAGKKRNTITYDFKKGEFDSIWQILFQNIKLHREWIKYSRQNSM